VVSGAAVSAKAGAGKEASDAASAASADIVSLFKANLFVCVETMMLDE
jgi:hypothetical protein